MTRAARLSALVCVLVAAAFVAWGLVVPPRDDAPHSSSAFQSSRQCRECHPRVYAEWEDSMHSQAFIDPEVRKLSNDYANEQCIDCHAPRPVFETGLEHPPLPRVARRAEGVDCIACHAREDTVVGITPTAAGPCVPRHDPRLKSVDHCATCHDQHFTVQEWKATPFAAQGVTCVTCHMTPVTRDGRTGADHASPASRDLELLRKAVSFRAWIDGSTLRVSVKNVGAGHHFPTDERSRAADLLVHVKREDGSTVEIRRLDRYRNPYRDQVGASDGLPFREESPLLEKRPESTLLPFGVERTYALELPKDHGLAEVKLLYKTIPFPVDPAEILADTASVAARHQFVVYEDVLTW